MPSEPEHHIWTVGPSALFPSVARHLNEALASGVPSLSHRSRAFEEIFQGAVLSLKKLLSIPEEYRVFFISSGTEGMERIIQNTVLSRSGHITNGAFSRRWEKVSKELGRETESFSAPDGEAPNLEDVSFSDGVELICITQNETSMGSAVRPSSIAGLRARHQSALIGVDIVSSAPIVEVPFKDIDYAFFSVQKCFGLPAGLCALVVSPRALARAGELSLKASIGSFHSFLELQKYADRNQTPETPNVLGVYLLMKVASEMAEEIVELRSKIEVRAGQLYRIFEESSVFNPFVQNPSARSTTTLVAAVKGGSLPVIQALKEKGIVVSSGYGSNKENHIRIGNFPAHSDEEFDGLCRALESFIL